MFEGYNFEDMSHYASFPQSGGAQQQALVQQQQAVPMQQQALVQQQQAVPMQQQALLNVVESNFYTDNNLSIDGSFMLLDFVSGVPRIYGNVTESSPGYTNSFQNGAIAGRPVYRIMDPNQTF